MLSELRGAGVTSLGEIAAALNARGMPAARGGAWSATQVQRVMARL
ncbi:recombinase-like helix-turn-helix domain-containing protein [Methylobacterium sp. P31]